MADEALKESDRAQVIVAAIELNAILEKIIKKKLLPEVPKNDRLFQSNSAPLVGFSAKIELSYRMGLINKSLRDQLFVVRKIRNMMAHDIEYNSFTHPLIKPMLVKLYSKMPNSRDLSEDRKCFDLYKQELLHQLDSSLLTVEPIKQ